MPHRSSGLAHEFSIMAAARQVLHNAIRAAIVEIPISRQTSLLARQRLEHGFADLLRRARDLPDADFIHLALEFLHVSVGLLPVVSSQEIATASPDSSETPGVGVCRPQHAIEVDLHAALSRHDCYVTPSARDQRIGQVHIAPPFALGIKELKTQSARSILIANQHGLVLLPKVEKN